VVRHRARNAEAVLGTVVGWVSTWFGWYYIALATAVLVFVIVLGFSRYGSVRLGPEHSRPEFSTGAWAAMLFAAGIGTDLMFFAVYEPVTQYLTPPSGEGETVAAAREATVWTLFHYGISGWGMYCLMGMALAYFAYRMNLPLAVRSALYPLIGKRVEGPIGHAATPPRCSARSSAWPPRWASAW
jgi:choline/glycine/proline betaine transport protein